MSPISNNQQRATDSAGPVDAAPPQAVQAGPPPSSYASAPPPYAPALAPGYPTSAPPPGYAGYPQPLYYPQPNPYYPPPYAQPGYYPPGYAPPPGQHTMSTMAGVLWILCLVRDLLYLVGLVILGGLVASFGFGAVVFVFAIFPILGVLGSTLAMLSDFQRKNHAQGTVGAVLAIVGSSFPGIFLIGPVGLVLSVVGLVVHFQAKREFPMA